MNLSLLFVRLKFRMIRNSARGGAAVMFIVAVLFSALAAFGALVTMATARYLDDADLRRWLVIFGANAAVVTWTLVAVFVVGADRAIDPQKLALLPLSHSDLRRGLFAASLVSGGALIVGAGVVGTIIGYAPGGLGAVLVALASFTVLAQAVGTTQAVAAVLLRVQRKRRGRDLAVLFASLGFAVFYGGSQLVGFVDRSTANRIENVLAWTPPGWAARSVLHASAGALLASLGWLLPAVAAAFLLVRLWIASTERLLVDDDGSEIEEAAAEGGRVLFVGPLRNVTATAATAQIARAVLTLVRSPAQRSAVVTTTVMGSTLVLVNVVRLGSPGPPAVYLALGSVLFSLNHTNNQFGFDPGALWIEASTGVRGRELIIGRNLVGALSLLPPILVSGAILAAITGGWKEYLVLLGVGLAVAPVLSTLGGYASTQSPIPMADHRSIFANRNAGGGQGCMAGIVGLGSLVGAAVLCAPILFGLVVLHDQGAGPLAGLVVGSLLWSAMVSAIAFNLVARSLDRRLPELLAAVAQRQHAS